MGVGGGSPSRAKGPPLGLPIAGGCVRREETCLEAVTVHSKVTSIWGYRVFTFDE